MKFLLDENVEFRIARFLQDHGHDVTTIAVDYPQALPDPDVLAIAVSEQRILLTNDRDFGELIVRHKHPHAGVIYLRLPPEMPIEEKIERFGVVLAMSTPLPHFLTLTPKRIRVRKPQQDQGP